MKTIILFGSPRRKGNTRRLVDAFSDELAKDGHAVKFLALNDMNVRPCQGCLVCSDEGACRIDDDMKAIRTDILDSELLVYATPVYWWGPSSQLKLVIDRSVAFMDANMESRIKGKKAVTLMTCADESLDTFTPALDMFRRIFDGLSVTYVGGVEEAGCEGTGKVSRKALERARKLARSLAGSV